MSGDVVLVDTGPFVALFDPSDRDRDTCRERLDATLVVLAERLGTTRVFTLDRKDFAVYRSRRRRFAVLPAAASAG